MPKRGKNSVAFLTQRGEALRYAETVCGDRTEAEDLVQEAWLRCERVAAAQPVERPTHLFWRVLRNLSIDSKRRTRRENRSPAPGDTSLDSIADDRPSVEEMLIAREELRRIQMVLGQLDERTRIAFEMHRFEGAKLREVAARLGISITVAHGLVARAVAQMRDAIRDI